MAKRGAALRLWREGFAGQAGSNRVKRERGRLSTSGSLEVKAANGGGGWARKSDKVGRSAGAATASTSEGWRTGGGG